MEYLGYEIEIVHDEYPDNPREWDNLWTLVTAHRNYSGEEELSHDCESMEDAFEEHLKDNWLTMDKVYYHRVWLYEHSWVTISTSPFGDRWDSWQWWYIYISIEDAEQNMIGKNKEALEKESLRYLDTEIKTLDKYYTWEIYEYRIQLLWEMSWWYESEEEALTEAKAYIDSQDPEWKTMKLWEELYEQALDNLWDYINEQTFERCRTEDDNVDEDKRKEIIEIVWSKLREY